jgi:methyltransferase-like protein 6
MADDGDDEKCFGDTLPSFEPCDDEYAESARQKIASDATLAPFFQQKYVTQARTMWDKFYKRNATNFFKDRHWIQLEFTEIGALGDAPRTLFEVGCGVGNTFFPLLERCPHLEVYAVDFAPNAIEFIQVCVCDCA